MFVLNFLEVFMTFIIDHMVFESFWKEFHIDIITAIKNRPPAASSYV